MPIRRSHVLSPVDRRQFLRLLGAGAATVASPSLARVASAPRRLAQGGGELIVGAPQDRTGSSSNGRYRGMYPPAWNVFETLVGLSHDFAVEPALAESWEFIAPNTWRFILRDDVVFHNGAPFTAEAVQWSMARIADEGGWGMYIGEDSTKIVDDHTVDITPTEENFILPLQLSQPGAGPILAPGTDNAVERIGTGPFREVEYVPDQQFVGEPFPEYWGAPPLLSRMTFRYMPDPTTRMLALQAGEVDLIFDVPREAAAQLGSGGLRLITSPVGSYEALYFNIHGAAPFELGQDPVIREAVSHAVDTGALIEGAWQGLMEPNHTMVPPVMLGEAGNSITGLSYDPAVAAQMLDAAGWTVGEDGIRQKDGRRLQLTMVVGYPSAEIHRPMPEFVQAQLLDIGIALEIVQIPDVGAYRDRLVRGEGDLWAENGGQGNASPCALAVELFTSSEESPEVNPYANAFAPGPEFDALLAECVASPEIEDVQAAAADAFRYLIDEQHIVLPLGGVIRLYGASERVLVFEPHPSQFHQRWDTTDVTAGA
jgi:peptide/nickel transport system substrate-binding protein